jgi:1-acyl-sn-glycerol-3-phosphate acyltransferase
MRFISAPFKLILLILALMLYLLQMCVIFLLIRERWQRVWWSNRVLTWYTRFGLFLFNFKLNVIGLEKLEGLKGALYVGNHTGYMDVFSLSSVVSSCFVTSVEIKQTAGLGQICVMSGCLFVERRNKNNIHNELSELESALKHGLNITIFPEATSTNGEQILRFRRPLFLSAVEAEKPIVPFCLNYRRVGGEPINAKNRDNVFWYGDMGFVESIFRLITCGGVDLDLHFLDPIKTTRDMDPRDLAAQSQAMVESVFIPVPLNEGAAESAAREQ